MKINSKIINKDLCVSCGLCEINHLGRMKMKKGIYVPLFKNKLSKEEDDFLVKICPGKGYPIVAMGKKLYRNTKTKYDYRLGTYISFGAATSKDKDLLKNSSSGGMIPSLANFLLKEKIVDGIVTVKFEYSIDGPVPKPFIAKSKEDLINAQGSKYMPVPLLSIINEIINFKGKLAFIGTPCQIAGLRLLQKENTILQDKIVFTISNFCGGYRDYRETKRIFNIFKIKPSTISYFSYRGNGQPGSMSINYDNKKVQIKYPEYSRLTGYIKHYRCRTCVDATGELADISFGDAWLPRFLKSGKKWSLFICRNTQMEEIIHKMTSGKEIELQQITIDELFKSQKGNLETKKERQYSRFLLYKILGKQLPKFDGGYNKTKKNIKLEFKVLVSHSMFYLLEKIGLYLTVAKLIKRVPKNNYEI